jgi:hypothetical protein
MKEALSDDKILLLREAQIINAQEVVYKVGDLFVAENVLTGSKRQISVDSVLTEGSSRRILKG